MRMRQAIGLSLALIILSGGAIAEEAASGGPSQQPRNLKAKSAKSEIAEAQPTGKRIQLHRGAALAGPDRYVGPVQGDGAVKTVGRQEIGVATWYGGPHIGRRTASGVPLDTLRATAAHRSLPLNSLARVTNLSNGRSVVVVVNDRGPAGASAVIDLSPRAADQLGMTRAGIAPVTVEPVATIAATLPAMLN
jgi:rare lipoprotein A (peptidoglycan hydrolase)